MQPSISEGFGLTVAEAMAAKLPVLVSNVPGTMEVIDGGKYGMIFESGNAEDLAYKIECFLLNGGVDAKKLKLLGITLIRILIFQIQRESIWMNTKNLFDIR